MWQGSVVSKAALQPTALQLPAPEDVPAWLAALVERDGEVAVLKALMATITGERCINIVQELCRQRCGIEPIITDSLGLVEVCAYTVCRLRTPCSLNPILTVSAHCRNNGRVHRNGRPVLQCCF